MARIDVPEWIPRVGMAGEAELPALGEQPVVSPYDRDEIARVAVSGEDAVDAAVAVALAAMGTAPIAAERARVLDRAAGIVEERAEVLAFIIAAESGKPVRQARGEVARCADTLRFSGAVARTASGEVIPMDAADSGAGLMGYTVREPIGPIAAITPFNFPLNLVAHKLGPAAAVGAPVVLKPAGKAPLSGLALAAILREAGLPPGMLGWVLGDGVAGEPLTAHPDVAMVSFTGSSAVGWAIRRARPDIRVALELGNATPVIVHDDADIALAARAIAGSSFMHAGQSCISVQRVLVQAEVQQQPHRDQLAKRAKAEALVVEARNAVSGAEASPRLRSAEQALQAANTAVSTSAAEKSCALNCRTLLEAQVTAATAEVSAARQELERRQKAAATTLADAKSALDALPSVEERTVVERRLGVEQWMADIVSALLLSIGANGAAFAFMAWGWHRPTETVAQPMPTAASVPVRAPIADVVDTTATAAEPHLESDTIGRFLAERTTIAEGVSTPVGMPYAVYQSWCADVGAEAVSLTRFGVTLGERGVKKARINGRVALVGIAPGARAA